MTYQIGPKFTEKQKQVLYGTILGGSSIIRPSKGKNCYLAMRDKNKDWLSYKVDMLSNFFKIDKNTIKKDKNTYRVYSVAYPIFNDMHNIFYKNSSKIIARETLEVLTDESWMVWFLDSGRRSKRKCYLRTQKFGKTGSETIAEYFRSLDCECSTHQCRGRYEVVFTNNGTVEFLKYITPKTPDFMA
jgi:hypothetical protein